MGTVLNPTLAHNIVREDSSGVMFNFTYKIDFPDGDDFSEYVIIRVKDLDKETQHKLGVLLQGKFLKR